VAPNRKEGKAAFTPESEQPAASPPTDMIKVNRQHPPANVADGLGRALLCAITGKRRAEAGPRHHFRTIGVAKGPDR
jgi:hypothetical protein